LPGGGAVDGQLRLIFYLLTFVYLLFFVMLSLPSFVPPPLNLHNRLVDNCGMGKEEVFLEAATEMEAQTKESKELLASVVYKKMTANNDTTIKQNTAQAGGRLWR
jgi:hypothetical protein